MPRGKNASPLYTKLVSRKGFSAQFRNTGVLDIVLCALKETCSEDPYDEKYFDYSKEDVKLVYTGKLLDISVELRISGFSNVLHIKDSIEDELSEALMQTFPNLAYRINCIFKRVG